MLQAPQESPYDWQFRLLDFPIRISWTFWLGAIVLGHRGAQSIDVNAGALSPGLGALLAIWIICVFVSILIHELGHALAFRQFGIESSVVLYHFGGLAIPSTYGRSSGRLTEKQDLWVTFAGPLAQIVSTVILIAIVKYLGYQVWGPLGMNKIPGMIEGNAIPSVALETAVDFYVYIGIFWAVLNLMPVFPLDGGRITRSLILLGGGKIETSLWISIIACGALAYYAFNHSAPIMAIFFCMFGFGNYQALQQTNQWRH